MQVSVNQLNVIAFDIPYPANYGGVIDIYYKLEALNRMGMKIHLHCYQYGREQSLKLNAICHRVYYYKRKTFKNPFYSKLPYIVASRNSSELLENLKKNDFPILFEGLHCCYYLAHPELKERFKIVRTHNVEHDYYKKLEEVENNFFKKYFFRVEAERLKKFESNLKHASLVAAISPNDQQYFARKYKNVIYIPAFHPNNRLRSVNGRGDYVFYHGNLSVGENDEAARFLINNVFSSLDLPLVIAGNNPSSELTKLVESTPNVELLKDVNSDSILEYVKNAHINVLPTFQSTGIKLKLINSLYLGRHCLANNMMVQNTGLEPFCTIANTPVQFVKKLKSLWKEPFSLDELDKRRQYLEQHFDNEKNAARLMEAISSRL